MFGPDYTQLFSIDTVWFLLKLLYIVAFILNSIFAFVVVIQVKQMISTLNGQLELPLKALSYILFTLSLIALVTAIIIL